MNPYLGITESTSDSLFSVMPDTLTAENPALPSQE